MIVSFFEEFPKKENLSKLKLVEWPTKVYIAARSLKEFRKYKAMVKGKNVIQVVYWPVLDKLEGYWISPFSDKSALLRVLGELKGKNIPVMIDAEIPFATNVHLYFRSFNFFSNKKLIQDFVKKHKDVYVCEYYPDGKLNEDLLSLFGLHFDSGKYKSKVIRMVYHSMRRFDEPFILSEIKRGKKQFGKNFIVAYGTIAKGIKGHERILSPSQLEKDLKIAKKLGVKEVVIYRLGGLNNDYVSVIKKFL
ncbi:MAG: hypothetical protein QW404_01180 [Candidatus Nanoarchaeia archaeon]